MHRSTDNDLQHDNVSTHAFVDIATGQFIFRDQPKTTAKVQVLTRNTLRESDNGSEAGTQSHLDSAFSPSDDAP